MTPKKAQAIAVELIPTATKPVVGKPVKPVKPVKPDEPKSDSDLLKPKF